MLGLTRACGIRVMVRVRVIRVRARVRCNAGLTSACRILSKNRAKQSSIRKNRVG